MPPTPIDRQDTGSPPQKSALTREAFDRLLSSLHPGSREAAGEMYQHLREGLIRYFERRRCTFPDALADQAFDRVALKLMTKLIPVLSETPGPYFRRVARFIHLEYLKKNVRVSKAIPIALMESDPDRERRFKCLERCLAELPEADRQFLLEYRNARATEKRELADSEGRSRNAVGLRAHKVLKKLKECSHRCFELKQMVIRK